jgi:hypothetical protein
LTFSTVPVSVLPCLPWNDGIGAELDDMFNITESMAEYEAEQEAEKEDVHEYVKGKAMNIGEEA